jgi:hypothetical protein
MMCPRCNADIAPTEIGRCPRCRELLPVAAAPVSSNPYEPPALPNIERNTQRPRTITKSTIPWEIVILSYLLPIATIVAAVYMEQMEVGGKLSFQIGVIGLCAGIALSCASCCLGLWRDQWDAWLIIGLGAVSGLVSGIVLCLMFVSV